MAQTIEDLAAEYRQQLVALEQKAVESFDKTVIALSGGALGLSLTFVKDIVDLSNAAQTLWLAGAWLCWAVSLACVLFSFWLSARAMREAIRQLDKGELGKKRPGGFWDWATGFLTFSGGLTFVLGVISMISFIQFNL
ncbi:MAG: hypothetical protein KF893_05005 [Caldilineaceae bacterium]|nr:hypothetical protein [Caldilineaceae bacterium]